MSGGTRAFFRPSLLDPLHDRFLFFDEFRFVHGRNSFQPVYHPQTVVFLFTHGVVGKQVQRFQVVELADKIAQIKELFFVVGYAGNHHMADPHIHMPFIQVGGKL